MLLALALALALALSLLCTINMSVALEVNMSGALEDLTQMICTTPDGKVSSTKISTTRFSEGRTAQIEKERKARESAKVPCSLGPKDPHLYMRWQSSSRSNTVVSTQK